MSFAAIDSATLHYRDSGLPGAPAVLLVHALGTDMRIWDEVAPLLAGRWRVIAVDLRGHGLSSDPAGDTSIARHAGDLLAVADRCGLDRFAIVGVSIGGIIAMTAALDAEDRVSSLVLCDTAGRLGSTESWSTRIADTEALGLDALSHRVVPRWVSPGYAERHPVEFEGWRLMLARGSAKGYIASCAALRDADIRPRLGEITAPALVLTGEHDAVTTPQMGRELAAALPDARFALLPGIGHVPPLEDPHGLAAHIVSHLEMTHDG